MNVPLLPGEAADEGALPGVVADEGALLGDTSNSEDVVIDEEYREIGNKSNVAGIDMEEDADDNGYDDYSYEEPDDPDSDDELRE